MTDITTIKENMSNEDYEIRLEACKELVEFPEEGIPLLIDTFNDENPHVRFQAAKSLAEIGTDSIKPLIAALNTDDAKIQ